MIKQIAEKVPKLEIAQFSWNLLANNRLDEI